MASRRRRRKGIGKVLTSVERKVRRIEKRPGAKRLKRNVVTTEKILPRAIVTKKIATDAVTANEAEFGVTVVTDTEPTEYLKEGTTWVNPDDGATQVYSTDISDFVLVTDAAASAAASDAYDLADTKNTVYRQDDAPTGGTYKTNDVWIDTNDNNQLYVWNGTAWVTARDGNIATAQSAANAAQSTANGKNTVYYSTSAPGSTPNTAGDIWFQYSGGIIVAQFSGAGGTSWTSTTIGNAVIANLDAGKITTGLLNVAGTVKVATASSGSRIELNSTGFYAYNGSTETVRILAANGSAEFLGTIKSGSTITGSSFSSTNITAGGGIAIGQYSSSIDAIVFYNSSSVNGRILGSSNGFSMYGPADQNIIFAPSGAIQLRNAAGTQGLLLSSGSTVTVQENSSTIAAVRNIEITTTATSHNSSASGYLIGDVRLVRQA